MRKFLAVFVVACASMLALVPVPVNAASSTNYSLSLNGNSFVEVPSNESLNITGPITVEAWIKLSHNGGEQRVVSRYGPSGTDGGYILGSYYGYARFWVLTNENSATSVGGSKPLAVGEWHHIAGVADGSAMRIYVDGKLDGFLATNALPASGVQNLYIGRSAYGASASCCYFNGLIDEARVLSGAIYANDFTPPRKVTAGGMFSASNDGSRGVWDFDAQTANDSSGNNNHGSLVGGAGFAAETTDYQAAASSSTVTINFDNLPGYTVVTNQYPQARFSSVNFNQPVTYSLINYGTTLPSLSRNDGLNWQHSVPLTVEFTSPVDNLKFKIIATDSIFHMCTIYFYRNNSLVFTGHVRGNGNPYIPVFIDSSIYNLNDITKITIADITDINGIAFDDFSFIPDAVERVDITNPRVSGSLSNTTQNAMLGADVPLQANITPSGLTGGTYSWAITEPYQLVSGATNQSALNIRWTQTGTYTATVSYTRNGVTVSSRVTVNVVVPTLSNFTASTNAPDQLNRGRACSLQPSSATIYSFGCDPNTGIQFNASAQIPSGQYLTDPAQSGVKFIQFGSEYRKFKVDLRVQRFPYDITYYDGRSECHTGRTTQADVDSGWQLDGDEVYGQPRRFSEGNNLTLSTHDRPGQAVEKPETITNAFMYDAFYVETAFEMYVYYFVGSNPLAPVFQRPLRLANDNTFSYHRIPWTWKGQVYYDKQNSPMTYYILQFTNTTQGNVTATGTNGIRGYSSTLQSNAFKLCPGEPQPTNNVIDSTRYYVKELYMRVLGRDPEDPTNPDYNGWDAWTSVIARCAFDENCIINNRVLTAKGFLESPEHFANNPALTNPGSPEYNREYVRLCYVYFLEREPEGGEDQGWIDILNTTGDYTTVVHGFVYSQEFRNNAGGPVCNVCPY